MARGKVHPSPRFWQEIAVVLAAKAIALALLYVLFFVAPPPVPDIGGHFFNTGARK